MSLLVLVPFHKNPIPSEHRMFFLRLFLSQLCMVSSPSFNYLVQGHVSTSFLILDIFYMVKRILLFFLILLFIYVMYKLYFPSLQLQFTRITRSLHFPPQELTLTSCTNMYQLRNSVDSVYVFLLIMCYNKYTP